MPYDLFRIIAAPICTIPQPFVVAVAPSLCSPLFIVNFPLFESQVQLLILIVMRLTLGRRLVNLLPVAQRTNNAFTNDDVDRPWIVGREFESHVHHENAF